jgi:creatinine amidohydrolase
MHRRFAELRAAQIPEMITSSAILVQPIGSVEQHGAHLPLATDLIVPEAVAEAVVASHGDELDLWLLPPLAYSKSDEHAWAPGTVWLSATTMLAVLDDLGRSVAATDARTVVFLNGHGGNTALLGVACRELRRRYDLRTFLASPWLGAERGDPGERGLGIHAGTDETSLLLHLRPDLVDMAKAARHVPEHLAGNRYVRFQGPVTFGWLADDFGPSGVVGDPTRATAARGERLFTSMVKAMAEALAEVARFDPSPGG